MERKEEGGRENGKRERVIKLYMKVRSKREVKGRKGNMENECTEVNK